MIVSLEQRRAYEEALQFWSPGREITCLEHLYVGIECITVAVLRKYQRLTGKSDEQLAAEWNINLTAHNWKSRLTSEARRRLVFAGDNDCATKAREVSDGFEHGYSDFTAIRKPAREILVRTAAHLRRAILETAGVEPSLLERMMSSPYSVPRGPLTLVRYVKGTLTGKTEQLAAKGEEYPQLKWKTELKTVKIGEDGRYCFMPEDKLTGLFGASVTMKNIRYEIWDGSSIVDERSQ